MALHRIGGDGRERRVVALTGADADHALDRLHEDLAVAHHTGAGGLEDGLDGRLHERLGADHFDLHLLAELQHHAGGAILLDDPVGAISVHGVNGLWGILSLGLLADGTYGDGFNGVKGAVTGLFYGDASQFLAQVVGGVANIVGVGVLTVVAWQITSLATKGHRVSAEVEELGLDIPEMGALAYPDSSDLAIGVVMQSGPTAKSTTSIAA